MIARAATVGRDDELTAIEEFLGSIGDGPGALVLKGEAGVGKTTLWRRGVERARELGIRVLVASPVEAETKLSLSTLGDLLGGVLADVLPALPAPQRRALEIALLLEESEQPTDPRTLGVSLIWVDELEEARALLRSLLERAYERVEESSLPWPLAELALAEYYAGDWKEATARADEAIAVALQTAQEPQRLFDWVCALSFARHRETRKELEPMRKRCALRLRTRAS
jgi:hypothetical protein